MKKVFNIADLFERIVDQVPEREAVVCGSRRLTYAELETEANCLAHFLQEQGVGQGDNVGLYLYNSVEYIVGMLACYKVRAAAVNINFRYVNEELEYIFNNAELKSCIYEAKFTANIAAIKADSLSSAVAVGDYEAMDLSSIGAVPYQNVLQDYSSSRDFNPRLGEDVFLLYTGGTTGMPKGVIWHQDTIFRVIGAGAYFRGEAMDAPDQVVECIGEGQAIGMPLAPLMHGTAWWSSLIYILSGNKLLLNDQLNFDGEYIWGLIEQEQVNSISIVGDAMAVPLMEALRNNPQRWNTSSLFAIGSAGALLSDAAQADIAELLPNVFVQIAFGSSESGIQNAEMGAKGAGLGCLRMSENAKVISDDLRVIEPGSDEEGTYARSGLVPVGYYNDPVKSAETFVDIDGTIWALTGDRATVDAEGLITLYGRGKYCINTGGEKVFPEEVENACKQHAGVNDCLVVATKDPRFTQRVAVVAVLDEGCELTLEQLQKTCREHIAGYKVPRELYVLESADLLRLPNGKPDYNWAGEYALSQQAQREGG